MSILNKYLTNWQPPVRSAQRHSPVLSRQGGCMYGVSMSGNPLSTGLSLYRPIFSYTTLTLRSRKSYFSFRFTNFPRSLFFLPFYLYSHGTTPYIFLEYQKVRIQIFDVGYHTKRTANHICIFILFL